MSYSDCNIFVGIDQSLNSTGYCIRYPTGSPYEDTKGLIKPGKRRGGSRLEYIYSCLEKILTPLESSSIVVCMEGYAYNAKGKVFELGECGGIIKLLLRHLGIKAVFSVPPTDLKKFVTGKASASKEQMMSATGERQDDIADATGLAWIAQEIAQRNTKERKKLEVISNCLKGEREKKEKPKYKRAVHKRNELRL